MLKKTGKTLCAVIGAVLIFQLTGCGTILYPERRGQKPGRLDAGVVLLDGIGLFFFLIPGIIAYAVDFTTGTIYLPHTASSLEPQDIKQVQFDPAHSSMTSIENIIKAETGCDLTVYRNKMQIVRLESVDDLRAHFAQALSDRQNACITLIKRQ